MASGVNSYEERSGSRVKAWSTKDDSFYQEFVLVNEKNSTMAFRGTETCETAHLSTQKISEKGSIIQDADDLIGCHVKVLRPKTKTMSEGVVASYDSSSKLHLVIYSDGSKEMLDLIKNGESAESRTPQQSHKTYQDASHTYYDDDMDGHSHMGKKLKIESSSYRTPAPSASHIMVKDLKVPKLEFDDSPVNSKLFAITHDGGLADVNGYRVKASLAPLLEAIFAKYGDITIRCLYKSASVRASLLEVICGVVQKLQSSDLEKLLPDLEVIENEILDVEASKISVSWLHEHLAKVRKVAALRDKSIQLTKTKARCGLLSFAAMKEMKQRHSELLLAQERFKEAEKRAGALRIVCRKIESDSEECDSQTYYWRRRMDDLL